MINLGNIAEVIKKVPGKTYKIIGTADKQTGSAKHNQMLSEKRAQKVYDTLVNKFGVNPSLATSNGCKRKSIPTIW